MNILVVSQYFWPENFRINDLVQEWLKRGHAVTVLTGKPNYPDGKTFDTYRADPSAFAHFEGAAVHRVPMLARGTGALRLMLNYASFVAGACTTGPWKLRRVRPDVIFVFEPSPVTVGLPAVLLGRLKRCPVVFWALDLWPETLAAVGVVRNPRLLAGVARLVRFIYDRCTLVLGQSRAFLPSIAQHCSDPSKVRYFPSWAEAVFSAAPDQPAPEVAADAAAFSVLFAGNVGDAQDFPAILDAAERLKHRRDIRWLIVGDGRRSAWLQEQVRERGLGERVLLLGRFPVERMPSFYEHADALLVSLRKDPTFSMTIPGKVQSYLAAGKPLLGMLDGEGADVIRRAGAGLACPAGDAGALADAVQRLAAMPPDERRAMGDRGRAFALREFDRGTLMDRMNDLLEEARALYHPKGQA
ncbi:glycosyltransferase family 4 protein [Hydrogenophaga sp. T2]|uniref:glycosyltransferase family 4 protein n=1 Tax=Hydrogenophaga sp. T2 TaxID=3132823 RepID=UPI003CEC03EB